MKLLNNTGVPFERNPNTARYGIGGGSKVDGGM